MGYVVTSGFGAILPKASIVASKVVPSAPGGITNPANLPECMVVNPYNGTRSYCGTDYPKSSTTGSDGQLYEWLYRLELWTETAHTGVRGEPSRLVFLEDFTRRNIAMWLTKDGIGTAVYDLSPGSDVSVDSYLLTRCTEAIRNFNDIFQPDRWQVVPHSAVVTCHVGSGSDQAGDHNYWFETWQEGTRPNPSAMNGALTRIFGRVIGAFERDPWLEQVWEIIKRVPRYSGPCCGANYDSSPQAFAMSSSGPVLNTDGTVPMLWPWTLQPEAPSKYFWRVANEKIEPTAWTKDFLDAFAPAKPGSAIKLTLVAAKKNKPLKIKSRVPMLSAGSGVSATKIAVIGAGAVVGAGILWWVFV